MLNADMALVMNFGGSIDSITGEVNCVPGELEGDSNDDICSEASAGKNSSHPQKRSVCFRKRNENDLSGR
jgi:hypothetical protein